MNSAPISTRYATPLEEVRAIADKGKFCVLGVDTAGAQQIRESGLFPDTTFVFVGPTGLADFEVRSLVHQRLTHKHTHAHTHMGL